MTADPNGPLPPPPPALLADRAEAERLPPERAEAILSGVRATLARPSWRDRLAELATPVRQALAVAALLVAGGALLLAEGLRADLAGAALARHLVLLAALLLACASAVGLALRGLHRPPPGPAARAAAVLLLAVPLLLAIVPGLWPGGRLPPALALESGRRCLAGALLAAAAGMGAVLLLARSLPPPRTSLLAAAGLGGMLGFVVQQAHCPAGDPLHLAIGHGTAGLIAGALGLAAARWMAR